ncbi:precorrin-3B C(17)-methyltransferase [Chloroflexia bacterium SDU3-3]|nr:precorrin-3B C(17)-methyltransferase [Chloroflexia bacterium SDU3-3]
MSSQKIAVVARTRRGSQLAARIALALGADLAVPSAWSAPAGAAHYHGSVLDEVRRRWPECSALILVMATGIATRACAPMLGDKASDPAVLCLDEGGQWVIPLIGGHQAGANALALRVAQITGGQAAITTASDTQGLPALDGLGKEHGWQIEPGSATTHAMAALVNGETLGLFIDPELKEQAEQVRGWLAECPSIEEVASPEELAAYPAALAVSHRALACWDTIRPTSIRYTPPALVAGIGCRRGVPAPELRAALLATLADAGYHPAALAALATAELKADEPGLRELASELRLPLRIIPTAQLSALDPAGFSPSAAQQRFDIPGVAEPCAQIAAGGPLVVPKRSFERCTVALALTSSREQTQRLSLIGIGPGDLQQMTLAARAALQSAQVVIGYRVYIEQVRPLLAPWQQVIESRMGDEMARAGEAIDMAAAGRHVALISSGDIGIYAMAGPVFELLRDRGWQGSAPAVEVLPGVSAFQMTSARLGAAIAHDLCTISLSDLLTPWEVIERRVQAAAEGDFVISFYNPRSKGRDWQLARSLDILRQHRPPTTPVALARNVSRPDETITITTLAQLDPEQVDMFTLVLVGNSQSYAIAGGMATPRGFERKLEQRGQP